MTDKYGNPWSKYQAHHLKALSPLVAVRHFCLDCCCEVAEEVKLCPVQDCTLWPFRFGAYPENYPGPRTVLKPIKAKCKDCMPDLFKYGQVPVRDCERKSCPIWPYRLGTNPKRRGKGGIPPESNRFAKKHGAHGVEIDLKVKADGKG